MSRRYKGGVISATAPTTSTSSATGVWTLPQQMQAIVGSGWPSQPSYWIGLLGASGDNVGFSVAVAGTGNVYICGRQNPSGSNSVQVAKYNALGVIQWQRTLGGTATERGNSISLDSSENIYISGFSSQRLLIAKYNTSGSIQWQRRLGPTGGETTSGEGVAVDSSGNVYVSGYSNATGNYDFLVAKYDTSGTIQWQRRLGSADVDNSYSIAVDGSNNVYVCGRSYSNGLTYLCQLAKYNSSGTIQWQRNLGQNTSDATGYSIAVDVSGNVYVTGSSTAGGTNIFLAKYNTSGSIQWQRRLASASSDVAYGVTVDVNSDPYLVGTSADGGSAVQIAKYNSSGTIQWQRRLGSSGVDVGYSVKVDSLSNLYVCGYTDVRSASDILFAKLPSDGSATGTYTVGGYSFTYEASTLSDSVEVLTDAASTLTDAATSLTDAASTLTDAASTLTSSVTTI